MGLPVIIILERPPIDINGC